MEVFHTLLESVVLVAAVILLFLQDWKALLLPVIDMAVSLVGTFVVMMLAGLLVQHPGRCSGWCWPSGLSWMTPSWCWRTSSAGWRRGLPVREATIHAMNEITGPILGDHPGAQLGAAAQRLSGAASPASSSSSSR